MEDFESVGQLLQRRDDVRLAYLFGSAARGERTPRDLDVAVLFARVPEPRDLDRLTTELQETVHRRVDLVVLNAAPPLLAHEVIATGRLVLCRDEDERVRFEAGTVARYLDTAYLRKVQHGYLRERVEAYRARSS